MGRIATRTPFHPSATFVVRKAGPIAGVPFAEGDIVPGEALHHLGPRRMEQLWSSRWVDVATEAEIARAEAADADELVVGSITGSTIPVGTITPSTFDSSAITSVQDTTGIQDTTPVAAGPAVAVYHEGFGRWYGRDADGKKTGDKMTKDQAEATLLPVVEK